MICLAVSVQTTLDHLFLRSRFFLSNFHIIISLIWCEIECLHKIVILITFHTQYKYKTTEYF